ncbi:MAG: glycosyltransferase [Thermoleophilia bacterium]|jgi:glycosyltransferase involved in cell wall biosynthesis
MRRLQVLHVIGGGDTGGAMSHLLPLLSALRTVQSQGLSCDAHLLCLGEGGLVEQARLRGLPVCVLPMDSAWDASILPGLRRMLTQGPVGFAAGEGGGPASALALRGSRVHWDVVHTHGMRANLPVRLVLRGLRHGRRPCLFTTVHSDLLLDYASPAVARTYQLLDRATLGLVDTVICVSESLRALLLRRGYPAGKVMSIWSGIEWPVTEGVPETAVSFPAPSGGVAGGPRMGTIARLVPVKDLELALQVAALLRRTIPGLEYVIVGDGPERARLETLVQELALQDVVRLTGRLDKIEPMLTRLDLFLTTSVFEGGVSMSVLEAMAFGLPVVTTAAGGVAEAVKDGETGFVVTRDQERAALAAALAERAALLLNDKGLRARMGAAGFRRVRDLFRVERAAARTLWAYGRCMAARSGRG